jgi:hypothetical protein
MPPASRDCRLSSSTIRITACVSGSDAARVPLRSDETVHPAVSQPLFVRARCKPRSLARVEERRQENTIH